MIGRIVIPRRMCNQPWEHHQQQKQHEDDHDPELNRGVLEEFDPL